MKHIITAILLIIFLSLAGYSIYQVTQFNAKDNAGDNTATHHHPINDQNISQLEVTDLKNQKSTLKTYLKHDINIINIWASWCGPCNEEMPELVQFDAEKPNHIGLIGMNVQDKPDKRDAFIKRYNADYPMIMLDEALMKKYKIYNVPTTLFINKDGKVVKTYVGQLNRKKLETILQNINE